MEQNIVNWGLTVSAWGKITVNAQGKDVYEAPKMFKGTRQINFTPDGQQTKVYADGTVVYVGNQNSGYTGTMEVTNLDDEFAMYALGETETDKKVIVTDLRTPSVLATALHPASMVSLTMFSGLK